MPLAFQQRAFLGPLARVALVDLTSSSSPRRCASDGVGFCLPESLPGYLCNQGPVVSAAPDKRHTRSDCCLKLTDPSLSWPPSSSLTSPVNPRTILSRPRWPASLVLFQKVQASSDTLTSGGHCLVALPRVAKNKQTTNLGHCPWGGGGDRPRLLRLCLAGRLSCPALL